MKGGEADVQLIDEVAAAGPALRVWFCSNCGRVLKELHDDAPALCPGCRRPLEERRPISLRELSSALLGEKILLKALIVGEGPIKATPLSFIAQCEICGCEYEINIKDREWRETFFKAFFIPEEKLKEKIKKALPRGPCKIQSGHIYRIEVKSYQDYSFVKLSPLLDAEEAQEREREVRTIKCILLDKTEVKKVLLDAELIIMGSGLLGFLAYKAYPLEEIAERPTSKELARCEAFRGVSLVEAEELLDQIIAPAVRGRRRAKLLAALTALSPKWLRGIDGGLIPGCMRVLFIGDLRTGKGMILRWFWSEGLAGHAVGETASRTGLIYSIDPDESILSWGVLPLNDGGMAVIEGLHGLPSEEVARLREALAQMRVEVHRKVSGAAWCRTRVLSDLNPRRPMREYLHPCLALQDSEPFRDPADLTRWDLALPFFADDVSPREMYGDVPKPSQEEEETFQTLVRYAWSLKSDDVIIKPEAFNMAVKVLEKLKEEYEIQDIPLIHNGSQWTVLRIASAIAVLEFNTDDKGRVNVEEKQVKEAEKIIKDILNQLELGEYKARFGEEKLTKEEYEKIKEELDKDGDLRKILNELVRGPLDSEELAGRLEVSQPTIRRKTSHLKELGIVRRRRGYSLTLKGVQFLKWKPEPKPEDKKPIESHPDHFDHFDHDSGSSINFSGKIEEPPGESDQNDHNNHLAPPSKGVGEELYEIEELPQLTKLSLVDGLRLLDQVMRKEKICSFDWLLEWLRPQEENEKLRRLQEMGRSEEVRKIRLREEAWVRKLLVVAERDGIIWMGLDGLIHATGGS